METEETTTIITTSEGPMVGLMGGLCYPTHHDYAQAHGPDAWDGLPLLMFCRLCGDVREIKVHPQTPTIATED